MDTRARIVLHTAPPLAAVTAACALFFVPPSAPLAPAVAHAPAALEHCQRAAELLSDLHWAIACTAIGQPGDDCMLPDEQAARVNTILAREEARCLAVEALATRGTVTHAVLRSR